MTDDQEMCTSGRDWRRHRAGELAIPTSNAFLGVLGRTGTTACGQPDAMDQTELEMLSAECHVPKGRRATIEHLEPCTECFPAAAAPTA